MDYKGALVAGAGGLLAGAGAYALDGADYTPKTKAGILIGAGLVAGIAATALQKNVGMGLLAGGVALGSKTLLDIYMAKTESMGAVFYPGQLPGGAGRQLGAVVSFNPQTQQWSQEVPAYR